MFVVDDSAATRGCSSDARRRARNLGLCVNCSSRETGTNAYMWARRTHQLGLHVRRARKVSARHVIPDHAELASKNEGGQRDEQESEQQQGEGDKAPEERARCHFTVADRRDSCVHAERSDDRVLGEVTLRTDDDEPANGGDAVRTRELGMCDNVPCCGWYRLAHAYRLGII